MSDTNTPRPVDKSRSARIVLAQIDNDQPRAEAAFQEAIDEGTVPELFAAMNMFVLGLLRLLARDNLDHMREWAFDIIAKAQQDEEEDGQAD